MKVDCLKNWKADNCLALALSEKTMKGGTLKQPGCFGGRRWTELGTGFEGCKEQPLEKTAMTDILGSFETAASARRGNGLMEIL